MKFDDQTPACDLAVFRQKKEPQVGLIHAVEQVCLEL